MSQCVIFLYLAARSGRLKALNIKSDTAKEVRNGAVECLLRPWCPTRTVTVRMLPTIPRAAQMEAAHVAMALLVSSMYGCDAMA